MSINGKSPYKSGTPEYNRWYREQNRERLLEYDRKRWAVRRDLRNKERRELRASDPEYRERERKRSRDCHVKYREERNAKMREYHPKYYAENRDKVLEYQAKYREENREACLERQRPHWRLNSAKRKAHIKDRTPTWADSAAIKFFYECCPDGCHVDHIIPLRGKVVSGLHIAENLQWLPAEENLRKGNSYGI